tara:strand:- start:632 stop:760 length:129 start_codon:yes stop_codon:yes gene_type:complete
MELFKKLEEKGHEQVSFFQDPYLRIKGIVAIYNKKTFKISYA